MNNNIKNLYSKRYQAAIKQISNLRLDCVFIQNEITRISLTGVRCDSGALILSPTKAPLFMTDFRYTTAIARIAPWLSVSPDWRGNKWKEPLLNYLRKTPKRIGYESTISAADFNALSASFPKAKFIDVSPVFSELRRVKLPHEINALRTSETVNDEVWSRTLKAIKFGMSEKDIQKVIRKLMIDLGNGESFETIVCVGKNAAECHHVPDDTVWHKHEPLLVDMGIKCDDFVSDMTRNIIPQNPTAKYRTIYNLVLKANKAAIKAVKPGVKISTIDKIARKIIADAGYGDCFGHALGHGVGLEIHEAPAVSSRSDITLKSGMVITIEPGIYIPDELGVRIEDLVLVTKTGCEVLSHSKKEFKDCILKK